MTQLSKGSGFVYGLVSTENKEKIRYVGVTTNPIEKRLYAHIYEAIHPYTSNTPDSHKNRWIRKSIADGYKINILLLETVEKYLFEAEKKWIAYFGRKSLTNGTDGGSIPDKNRNISNNTYNKNINFSKIRANTEKDIFKRLILAYREIHRQDGVSDMNIVFTIDSNILHGINDIRMEGYKEGDIENAYLFSKKYAKKSVENLIHVYNRINDKNKAYLYFLYEENALICGKTYREIIKEGESILMGEDKDLEND